MDDDLFEEEIRSALLEQVDGRPACSRDPSSYCPCEPAEDQISYDDGHHVSRDRSKEPSPNLNTFDDDNKGKKQHGQQEVGEDAERGERDSGGSRGTSGDGDDDHYNNDQDSDDSEGPRPAKRRRPSSSHSDPTSGHSRKRHLQRPCDSRSRSLSTLDSSHTAPARTQLQSTSSLRCDNHCRSQRSPTPSLGDDELTPNTRAEYQEWPLHGFFKRTIIGNETRYCMEFSLEEFQKLRASASPLHTSRANSNVHSSMMIASSFSNPTRTKKPRSALSSRSLRTRFTQEEDTKLIDLKETKRWSWDQIEGAFPGRSRGSLQVHYCTKLKGKLSAVGKEQQVDGP